MCYICIVDKELLQSAVEHFRSNPLIKYISENSGYGKIEIEIENGEINLVSPSKTYKLNYDFEKVSSSLAI